MPALIGIFQDFDRSGMETLYQCHCFGLIILLQLINDYCNVD